MYYDENCERITKLYIFSSFGKHNCQITLNIVAQAELDESFMEMFCRKFIFLDVLGQLEYT